MDRNEAQSILGRHSPFPLYDPAYPAVYKDWLIDAMLEAVAKEREACAKACDDFGASYDNEWNRKLGVANDLKDACDECAAAIRARPA